MLYEVEDLHFSYRCGGPEVLRGVNLRISEGEIFTVLGRNGAGKSTLFSLMLGLKKPDSGRIKLCGADISKLNERRRAEIVGYVPQGHQPAFAYSVEEFIMMGCASALSFFSSPGMKEKQLAQRAMEKLGIEKLAQRPYTELSGGERQQAAIARAIVREPKIIIFDEPAAHLDFANQIKVLRIIKELSRSGFAVAMSTHDPNHPLLLGGRTGILCGNGKMECGENSIILTEDRLRELYGEDLCLKHWDEQDRDVCLFPNI